MKHLLFILISPLFKKAAENATKADYLIIHDEEECQWVLNLIGKQTNLNTLCELEILISNSVNECSLYHNIISRELLLKKLSFLKN